MDIAIIRHLPTIWNKKGFLQGKRDTSISFPLTIDSQNIITENKRKLKMLMPFDHVLTSELLRTKQTALCYGFTRTVTEPLLNELDYGEFEGKTKAQLEKTIPEWKTSPLHVTLGESLHHFQQRIYTFFEKYAQSQSILIFGHGSWIRALISIIKMGTIQEMNQLSVKNNELIIINKFVTNSIDNGC